MKTPQSHRQCKKCGIDFVPRYSKQSLCDDDLSKMGKRNKNKGSSNELRLAKKIAKYFDKYELKYRKINRTPRSGGISDLESADIMFMGIDKDSMFNLLHIEAKNTENWSIPQWFDKVVESEQKNGRYRHPVIIARKPGTQRDFGIVDLDLLLELLCSKDILMKQYER